MRRTFHFLVAAVTLVIATAVQAQTGTVAFSQANYSAPATNPVAVITVVYSGGTNGSVTVDFSTANGTALAGTDYQNTTLTLNFSDSVLTNTVFVPLLTASSATGDLTVNLALSNLTGAATLGRSNALLTIIGQRVGGPPPDGAHVLPVSFTGILNTSVDGKVSKFALTNHSLIDSGRLALVVIGTENVHEIDLVQLEFGTQTNITTLATTTTCAFLDDGAAVVFSGNLQFESLAISGDGGDAIGGSGSGDIQVKGSYIVAPARLIKATLLGVLNDSVNGSDGGSDAILKGTLTPVSKEIPVNNIIWPE